jgi:hypothetical protein
MTITLTFSYVPMGHYWRTTVDDEYFGMDWHQIKVWFNGTFQENVSAYYDMIEFAQQIAGNPEDHKDYILQDWYPTVNFIFIHMKHAIAFKVRFG